MYINSCEFISRLSKHRQKDLFNFFSHSTHIVCLKLFTEYKLLVAIKLKIYQLLLRTGH